jgi:membrane protein YdbS with pleckstrin-like domain
MPLPRRLLNDDEELLAEMRPHWVFYGGPLGITAVVWVAVLVLVIGVKPPAWASYPLLVIAAIPTIWLAGRLIRWATYTLALTSTRILLRQGVFGRDTTQLRLQRITEVNLAQTLPERILGTGRIVIDVQGEDDSLVLQDVRKPAVVQRVINSQINELVGGGSREDVPEDLRPHDAPRYQNEPPERPTPTSLRRDDTPPFGTEPVSSVEPTDPSTPAPHPGSADGGIHEKLIELDDLRRRGILTEEEFQTKKAQLIDRI